MTTRRQVRRLLLFGLCFGMLTLGLGRTANAQPITVTNTGDSGPGSLRQAIADANPAGGDTIDFAGLTGCPCAIVLTSGEVVIDKNLTIKGPGPALLTISGNEESRVFRIAPGVTATLDGLQVMNGTGVGGGTFTSSGGGILNEGTLSLVNIVVFDNHGLNGGGIYSLGPLRISRSDVRSNTATGSGGGIFARGLSIVRESTIAGNSTTSGPGGGIYLESSGALTFVGGTISNNSTNSFGGGLFGTAMFVNSTISGNLAVRGGGVARNHDDDPLTLIHSTVTNNTATFTGTQSPPGGGIGVISAGGQTVLTNTIVMGNLPDDVPNAATSNNSLIGGDAAAVLLPLAENGGPTLTHALVPGGPAIGAGGNAWLPNDALDLDGDGNTQELLPVDQRGVGFPRLSGTNVDIGAFEVACTAIGVTPATLPTPVVGVAYSQTLGASGGTGPLAFSATGLPPGLTLTNAGVLSGTPTASGTYTISVTVTDALGCGGTQTYTVTIADPSCGIVIGPATLKTPSLATLYYQPLSVTPSGQYTVSVSAGALPDGVYLFAVGHSWFLGGIPTKPGQYTFTLAAKKKNSSCAPTRSYTVIVPGTVLPQLTCVAKTGAEQYTARFGYDNSTGAAVAIPVGADNSFTPGAQNRGQVTTFQPGRVTSAFTVAFTVSHNRSDIAIWLLRGPDGVRRPVNITTATSSCQ